jgi:hypothetical protein
MLTEQGLQAGQNSHLSPSPQIEECNTPGGARDTTACVASLLVMKYEMANHGPFQTRPGSTARLLRTYTVMSMQNKPVDSHCER